MVFLSRQGCVFPQVACCYRFSAKIAFTWEKSFPFRMFFLRFRGKAAQALHFDTLPVRPLENRVFPSVGQDPRFFEDGNRSGS